MGEVGEGIPGDEAGYAPPDMLAVSEFEAAVAAAEGLRLPFSCLSSCMVLGTCVGEWPLGVEPRPSFFENDRVRLVFSGCEELVTGGEISD